MEVTEKMFKECYPRMFRVAYRCLRDTEASKDVVSGVFASLCEEGNVTPSDVTEGWLAVCVRNACLNHLKRLRIGEKVRRLYPITEMETLVLPDAEDDRLEEMRHFIDTELPLRARRAFKLCFFEGRTYKQAASECGCSVSAVNKYIVQALYGLRQRFGK